MDELHSVQSATGRRDRDMRLLSLIHCISFNLFIRKDMQKRAVLLFGFFIYSSVLFAQHLVRGRVIDRHTRQPLEFACVNAGQGKMTMTDDQGIFRIMLTQDDLLLTISIVGYRSLAVLPKKRDAFADRIGTRPRRSERSDHHAAIE
jgi:hypothetical protein